MKTLNANSRQNLVPADAEFEKRVESVMVAVDLYHVHLQDYLYQLTRHWQDSEDLLQELWRYVLLHFPENKIQSLGLLRRKAYQLFVDYYRAAQRRPEVLTQEPPEVPVEASQQGSFSAEAEQGMKERFWQEFPEIDLSDLQKDVLWQHGRYGLTYQEIEQKLGVPASTVGDWMALGRQRLGDYIGKNL